MPIQIAASFVRKKPELCSYTPRHSRNEKCALVVLFGKVSVSVSSRFGGYLVSRLGLESFLVACVFTGESQYYAVTRAGSHDIDQN